MKINVCRIDDRLVHGQIVTKWIKEADANLILVADDKAAGDKTLQMILKLAVPSGVKIEILNKEDSISRIQNDHTNQNVLLLIRNPAEAEKLVEMGLLVEKIIVGNISNSKSSVGRTKLLDYIWVEPADVKALQNLSEKGIKLEVKAIPEERAKDPMELIAKSRK
jgi:mannose/fructose/N-acetylgalactosamine-specific phosphotransferase system component IIB